MGDKAKIRKFKKAPENYDVVMVNKSIEKKRSGKPNFNPNKIKIKKIINPPKEEYGFNNIIVDNSTYNQTTFNIYTNKPVTNINKVININTKKSLPEGKNKIRNHKK